MSHSVTYGSVMYRNMFTEYGSNGPTERSPPTLLKGGGGGDQWTDNNTIKTLALMSDGNKGMDDVTKCYKFLISSQTTSPDLISVQGEGST
jgi:hypothetical protein